MRTVAGHIPVRIIGVRVTPITVRQRYEPVARIAIRQVVSHRTRRRTLQRQDIAVEVVRKAALDEPVGAANALLGGELPARHPRDGRRGGSLHALGRGADVRRGLCPHGARTARTDTHRRRPRGGVSRLCHGRRSARRRTRGVVVCQPPESPRRVRAGDPVAAHACRRRHPPPQSRGTGVPPARPDRLVGHPAAHGRRQPVIAE